MSKKILILGAGLMQKPAILACKELGCQSLVVDANPQAVCVPLADRFEPIDLKDREALVRFAEKVNAESPEGEKIAAVFTAGTDFSSSVSYVAAALALPAHTFEASLNASDKIRMRSCFKASHVPSPGYIEINNAEIANLSHLADQNLLEFPKVVKPVDNMGGRGCRLVRNSKEFLSSLHEAVKNSRSSRAVFEDYMEGDEFSIDSIVCDGALTITGFADRHIYYPPYFIEMGHTMPSSIDEKKRNELIATFALGIKALGLTCGVAKADIKYTKKGPMIGEIAARLSGGYMSGWTYPYASDAPLTKMAMEIALGKDSDYLLSHRTALPWQPHPSVKDAEQPFELYEIPCARVSAERAWLSIPGRVAQVTGLDKAAAVPFVRDVLVRSKTGDTVHFPHNNVEKCGNIISVAESREEAENAAYQAIRSIVVRLSPCNQATDRFLSGISEASERGFPPSAFTLTPCGTEKSVASKLGAGKKIPAGKPVLPLLPESLRPFAESLTDWNHRTMRDALVTFDQLCPNHPELDADVFWAALLRASIQGILYVSDSVSGYAAESSVDEEAAS